MRSSGAAAGGAAGGAVACCACIWAAVWADAWEAAWSTIACCWAASCCCAPRSPGPITQRETVRKGAAVPGNQGRPVLPTSTAVCCARTARSSAACMRREPTASVMGWTCLSPGSAPGPATMFGCLGRGEPAVRHEHAGRCGHRREPPSRPAPVSRRRLPRSGAGLAANPFRHRSRQHQGTPFVLGAGHHLVAGDRCPARRDRGICAPAGALDSAPAGATDHRAGRSAIHRPGSAHRQSLHLGRGSRHTGGAPASPPAARRAQAARRHPRQLPPPRVAPSGNEQPSDLCHGVAVTAERLRHAGLASARQARWSPAATSASWRKDALSSAITGHTSELILRGLAERARQLAAAQRSARSCKPRPAR